MCAMRVLCDFGYKCVWVAWVHLSIHPAIGPSVFRRVVYCVSLVGCVCARCVLGLFMCCVGYVCAMCAMRVFWRQSMCAMRVLCDFGYTCVWVAWVVCPHTQPSIHLSIHRSIRLPECGVLCVTCGLCVC